MPVHDTQFTGCYCTVSNPGFPFRICLTALENKIRNGKHNSTFWEEYPNSFKKVYKCNRKLQFGHRTFSYSHIVLYVVCSSKLFLCGMTSFLTCPLPGSGCHSSLWLSQSHQRCLTCSGPESVWRHSLCSFLPCRRGGRVAAWSAW